MGADRNPVSPLPGWCARRGPSESACSVRDEGEDRRIIRGEVRWERYLHQDIAVIGGAHCGFNVNTIARGESAGSIPGFIPCQDALDRDLAGHWTRREGAIAPYLEEIFATKRRSVTP